jgi:5-methyltetrahydropteroyltriglutamate--homocysteine methyltransferase
MARPTFRSFAGGKLLPTTVVGSHAFPSWLWSARKDIEAGNYGPLDLGETLDDAVRIALFDQEDAGVDVVSDGEMRRTDFILGFYQRLSPLEVIPPARRMGHSGYDQVTRYRALDRLTAPQGLGLVAEFQFARQVARRPLKVAIPGPLTLCTVIDPAPAYPDVRALAHDLAAIVNAELKAVVAAGATSVQVDEPGVFRFLPTPEEQVALFHEAIAGVDACICLHVCFGNYRKQNSQFRRYSRVFPGLLAARADCFLLEFANRELAEIDRWTAWEDEWASSAAARGQAAPELRELAVGVIDVKSFHVETPEEVAWRIRQALQYVPAERLVITADCGFSQTARWLTAAKLRAMVAGADVVRAELAGREAR